MSEDCLFCKIVKGEAKTEKVYEDDTVLAFKDINPQAPVHIVVIPKKHIKSLSEMTEEDKGLLGHIQYVISKIASDMEELRGGYRVVNNCGIEGGQTIFHIHYHLLGGRAFGWPPG